MWRLRLRRRYPPGRQPHRRQWEPHSRLWRRRPGSYPTGVILYRIQVECQHTTYGGRTVDYRPGQRRAHSHYQRCRAGSATPPDGNTNTPDVVFTAAGNITISLATTNIPVGTPLTVRITAAGQVISAQSTPTDASGNATATITVPAGVGTIQAFATYVPAL
jgi:hypothetical protein